MPLDKEKAQDVIDDFVITNDVELNEISTQNPALFDATLNALNFLSARFGTGQKMQIVQKPKVVESGLPFKEGDKFTVPSDKDGLVYNLIDIDVPKGEVKVSWFNLAEKKTKKYTDSIKVVTERFNDGSWVLVEWYPLKVGYKFINNNNNKINYTILNIDESKNKGLEVVVEINGVPKVTDYEINDFIDNIELGFFSFIKDELPFKVGDKFYAEAEKNAGVDTIYEVTKIDGNTFRFVSNNGSVYNHFTTNDAKENFKDGKWVKIQTMSQPTNTPVLQKMQILFDVNEETLYEIIDIGTTMVELKSGNGKTKLEFKDKLPKQIPSSYLLANFVIGDIFTTDAADIISIYQLSATNKNRVDFKWIKNGKTEILDSDWGSIESRIENGTWKPLIVPKSQPQKFQPTPQTTQTAQDNPHDIKIGDLIVRTFDNTIWEVLDVNVKQDSVKLMTSSNKKETGNLSVLNIKIDDGDNEKLAFSMFDGFVTPNGDFFKIMELYPNNEKSVWVKVNDKPNLEVFQWDLIQDWIEDAYWMPGTMADADQIKADLLKAEEEAKAPKKKLTKLEKQIKDLQEEIDGLLFLADEDADAKAELEKKLIQIEALKAKKP
jgi:hypothetical protein